MQHFAFALRSSINESTQVSPALLNLGRELPLPFGRKLQEADTSTYVRTREELKHLPEKLKEVIDFVRNNMEKALLKHKKYFDKFHRELSFSIGELVMAKNHSQSNKIEGKMEKLSKRWIGPFKIHAKVSNASYELIDPIKNKLLGKRHVSELKPFKGRLENTSIHRDLHHEDECNDSDEESNIQLKKLRSYRK